MGNKYLISNTFPGNGYELLNEVNDIKIYENENAFSIGFVNTNLMSEKYYDTLQYPYNVEAIINNTIVNDDIENEYYSNIKKVKLEYTSEIENLKV